MSQLTNSYSTTLDSRQKYYTYLLLYSCLITTLLFIWQGNKGFGLSDESFLWYGTQRVLLGEVPIRDFMAYDPGRYYFSAALMYLFGDNGIISLRITLFLCQFCGLFLSLVLIIPHEKVTSGKSKELYAWVLIISIIMVYWMFPLYKIYDITISIVLTAIISHLIAHKTSKQHFITGFCVGLSAVFGRNHGLYGFIASFAAILWINLGTLPWSDFLKKISAWLIGILIGFSPILFMALLIPGFAHAFWESIIFMFELGTTNLTLSIPWPWKVIFTEPTLGKKIRGALTGSYFLFPLIFGLSGLMVLFRNKIKPQYQLHLPPQLVAAILLTLPYTHHAFARAAVAHLSQGIFPALIACFVVLSQQPKSRKWMFTSILLGTTVWLMATFHRWECIDPNKCVQTKVGCDHLWIRHKTSGDLRLINTLVTQYAANDQDFIVVPYWPGAYAALEKRAPMWEIYALFPRTEQFQLREINRIKKSAPKFAFIFNYPLDGNEKLRYIYTHALINQYIFDNFDFIPELSTTEYQVFKAKNL